MSDQPGMNDEARDTLNWVDGLAGREGAGAAHAEGAHLRQALESKAIEMPPWAEIVRQLEGAEPVAQAEPERALPEAANQTHWRPWFATAAAVAMATVLGVALWPSEPEVTMRGGTQAQRVAAPVWRVSQPEQAAQQLAAELKALGAQVEMRADAGGDGGGLWLTVVAPAAAVSAVNDRLAALETALNAQGHLSLRVQAPQ